MTPHNEANVNDIADIVLMPGDPLRAKYIAEHFLDNYYQVNSVRNMLGYTGFYKGKKVTVFASGMGIPSMGIYSYELFKFYNVNTIIRVGSCGTYDKSLNLLDTVLVNGSYTESTYSYALDNKNCSLSYSSSNTNEIINQTANELNISLYNVNALCSDCFDKYINSVNILLERLPKDLDIKVAEMESFALFYNANLFNKNASCLLSIVDKIDSSESISSVDRELSLNSMITLALESAIKIK